MSDNGNDDRAEAKTFLPVPVEPRQERPSLARNSVEAGFVSQLIAAREQLALQKRRRQAAAGTAADLYAARQAPRRMPPGYRLTASV